MKRYKDTMSIEWYDSERKVTWTVELSAEGIIEQIIFSQFNGRRLHVYTRNPSSQEFLLSKKILQDAFESLLNSDDQTIGKLVKTLSGEDVTLFESAIQSKIDWYNNLLANLKRT